MDNYDGEVGEVYKVSYAWYYYTGLINKEPTKEEIKCAWCHKSQAEIEKTEDLKQHIDKHDEEDNV